MVLDAVILVEAPWLLQPQILTVRSRVRCRRRSCVVPTSLLLIFASPVQNGPQGLITKSGLDTRLRARNSWKLQEALQQRWPPHGTNGA